MIKIPIPFAEGDRVQIHAPGWEHDGRIGTFLGERQGYRETLLEVSMQNVAKPVLFARHQVVRYPEAPRELARAQELITRLHDSGNCLQGRLDNALRWCAEEKFTNRFREVWPPHLLDQEIEVEVCDRCFTASCYNSVSSDLECPDVCSSGEIGLNVDTIMRLGLEDPAALVRMGALDDPTADLAFELLRDRGQIRLTQRCQELTLSFPGCRRLLWWLLENLPDEYHSLASGSAREGQREAYAMGAPREWTK